MLKKIIIFLLMAILLSACIEINVHYTINPDFSGKIETEYLMPVDPMGFGMALKDPEGKALKEIKKMVEDYPGVDSWTNIKYEYTNDSADIVLSATGYFKNFNNLKKKGMLPYELNKVDGKTYFTFSNQLDSLQKAIEKPKLKSLKEMNMTEQQFQDSVRSLKRNAKKGINMFAMLLSNLEFKTTYEFAGTIYSAKSNKKIGTGRSFKVALEGVGFQNYMLEEIDNDEYYENMVRGGPKFDVDKSPSENDDIKRMLLEFFSGEREDISRVKIEFEEPAFDFDEEYENSMEVWELWQKKLSAIEIK